MALTGAEDLTEFQRSLDLERIYLKGRVPAQAGSLSLRTLRILTWNIERGYQPDQIAEILVQLRPDVACLQEVDWGNQRTGSVDVLQLLAERTGALGLFGIEFFEVNSPARSSRLAGGGAVGNALLTRLEPISTFRVELPACLDWRHDSTNRQLPQSVRRKVTRESRIGRRFGLAAELEVGDRRLVVCSVHLEDKYGGVRGRWSQYSAVVHALEPRGDRLVFRVIAGDLNTFDCRRARLLTGESDETALGKPAGVTEAAWWMTELLPPTGYTDPFEPAAWTFRIPFVFKGKLDWITTKGAAARSYGVGPSGPSDHRLLWVDLALDGDR